MDLRQRADNLVSRNGVETQTGGLVTATPETYNAAVAAGGSITNIGFNGIIASSNPAPTAFAVNGSLWRSAQRRCTARANRLDRRSRQSIDHACVDGKSDSDNLSSEAVNHQRRTLHNRRHTGHNQLH